MLTQRILSAAIGIPVLLLFAWLGGIYWAFLLAVLVSIGLYEYVCLFEKKGLRLSLPFLEVCALLLLGICFYFFAQNGLSGVIPLLLGFVWIVVFIWMMLRFYRQKTADVLFATVLGIVYIAGGMDVFILLRGLPENGFWLLLLAFIITWATDSGAYFVGRQFGRHKLAPHVSPNKTTEGAIGGVLLAVFAVIVYNHYILHWHLLFVVVFAIAVSCMAQLGDLTESWLKRWAGVKDSGKFLPGHGGLLDRFDSMIFVVPWVYYAALLLTLL